MTHVNIPDDLWEWYEDRVKRGRAISVEHDILTALYRHKERTEEMREQFRKRMQIPEEKQKELERIREVGSRLGYNRRKRF